VDTVAPTVAGIVPTGRKLRKETPNSGIPEILTPNNLIPALLIGYNLFILDYVV
jgi:hypothetical protein